jgi:hypothetical protein
MQLESGQFESGGLAGRGTAASFGLSLLGLLGALSAALAALIMWSLLTAPAEVAVAVSKGPSELAGTMLRFVVEAVQRLLSWL